MNRFHSLGQDQVQRVEHPDGHRLDAILANGEIIIVSLPLINVLLTRVYKWPEIEMNELEERRHCETRPTRQVFRTVCTGYRYGVTCTEYPVLITTTSSVPAQAPG